MMRTTFKLFVAAAALLLLHLRPAAAGDVNWISPVLENSCVKTCSAVNNPEYPEYYMEAIMSNDRALCRPSDGRIGKQRQGARGLG
jgi:hypothetical protein